MPGSTPEQILQNQLDGLQAVRTEARDAALHMTSSELGHIVAKDVVYGVFESSDERKVNAVASVLAFMLENGGVPDYTASRDSFHSPEQIAAREEHVRVFNEKLQFTLDKRAQSMPHRGER